jgi:hypothetical protein
MDTKALIAARLAEWNLALTDAELNQLVRPYENLLRWQRVVEDMRQSRQLVEGMSVPESEPLLIHALDKKGGAR